MSEVYQEKIVEFDVYCPKCKHYKKKESEDPCWDCLCCPTNVWSTRPKYFEENK